jgi:DNA modification methylase
MPFKTKGALDGAEIDNTMKGPTNSLRPDQATKSQNFHPTVKPLALMKYLITLVMPPNPKAVVLDPFAGSGTTILAAKQLNRNAIGIELSPEYAEIARKRVESYKMPIEQFQLPLEDAKYA